MGLAAADFNADGKVDLAFSNSFSTADVYYGNGDGTFTYAASYPAIQGAQSVQSTIWMATASRTSLLAPHPAACTPWT